MSKHSTYITSCTLSGGERRALLHEYEISPRSINYTLKEIKRAKIVILMV